MLNTVSGSGLPRDVAGVIAPAVSWDCSVVPLENTVDWDILSTLVCVSLKILNFFFGC